MASKYCKFFFKLLPLLQEFTVCRVGTCRVRNITNNVLSTIIGLKLSSIEHIIKEKELERLPKKEKAH